MLIVGLLTSVILLSCDPNEDKRIGRPNTPFTPPANNGGGVGTGGGAGTGTGTGSGAGTTDVPIDGGLGVLLVAGALYGGKKMANARSKNKTKAA